MSDIIAGFFLISGSLLAFAGAVGLARFPDIFTRMHAATKPQTVGLIFILIGMAVRVQTVGAVTTALIVIVFQLLTAPVATHMVGRAAYRVGLVDRSRLTKDEL